MAVLRSRNICDKQRRIEKATLPKENHFEQRKSNDIDMLAWLKGLAMDPWNPEVLSDSSQKLWNQCLKLRKFVFWSNVDRPQRKRKLEQFLEGNSTESFNQKNVLNSNSSSSILTFEDTFRGKQVSTDTTSQDDTPKCGPLSNALSPINDTDSSVNASNPLSSGNLTTQGTSLVDFNGLIHSSDSSSSKEKNLKFRRALGFLISKTEHFQKPLIMGSFNYSSQSTHLSSLEDRNERLRQALRIFIFDGDHIPRPVMSASISLNGSSFSCKNKTGNKVLDSSSTRRMSNLLIKKNRPRPIIPIGSSYQAIVPEWTGPINKENLYGGSDNSKNLRWLGTRIWPLEGGSTKAIAKAIGKGRPDSCFCLSPGSVTCVKRHVLEKRLLLQFVIGPAFLSWKFDEMGEVVSKSWRLKEQQKFESLVRLNPLSNGTNFFELTLKHFPSKGKKSILSYYYNVLLPRRISVQTRSSFDGIVSDDD